MINYNQVGEEVAAFAHELSQPLMVINTYLRGCVLRLEKGKINFEQFNEILTIVFNHLEIINNQIIRLRLWANELKKENDTFFHPAQLITKILQALSKEISQYQVRILLNTDSSAFNFYTSFNQIDMTMFKLIQETILALKNHFLQQKLVISIKVHNNFTVSFNFLQKGVDNYSNIPLNNNFLQKFFHIISSETKQRIKATPQKMEYLIN